MNQRPLVSVITPAFNAEKYIAATIESVLAQTYSDWELIIVDDGSTDRTAEIVKNYTARDSRVVYVFQKNAGQSAARNAALMHSHGVYIAFLDADDLFNPEKLEVQTTFLEKNPLCGVCYCRIAHFFNDDPEKFFTFDVPHPSGNLFQDLLRSNFINPLSVVLRKNLLDQVGGFNPSFRRVDEQYLWLKLARAGADFQYLNQSLARYRVHRGSLSNEARYFSETEAQFIKLLAIIKPQMTPEERHSVHFLRILWKARIRWFIGLCMQGNNPFSHLLLRLYFEYRERRMVPNPAHYAQ